MKNEKGNRTERTKTTHLSSEAHPSHTSKGFIPAHGGYEDLLSFQKSRIIHDATVKFCARSKQQCPPTLSTSPTPNRPIKSTT